MIISLYSNNQLLFLTGTVPSVRYETDHYTRFTVILVLKGLSKNLVVTSCVFDVLELANTESS